MKILPLSIFFSFFLFSCSMLVIDGSALNEDSSRVLLVVDKELESPLASELEQYRQDLSLEGIEVDTLIWDGGASALREELKKRGDGTWSAFLVGEIPWVLYEMEVFDNYESFPSDLYYSAPATIWDDSDGNGIYDSHSFPTVLIPVSRLIGTETEIRDYFGKIHAYRNGQLTFRSEALIFKDDDWKDYQKGDRFALDSVVPSVRLVENLSDTRKPVYEEGVSDSYKYVYQWIHANPYSLYIQEGNTYKTHTVRNIEDNPMESGFFNLFNCKAARFDKRNLGMAYLTGTDSGLAVLGSTKVGGNFEPLEFHRSLSTGKSWSRSYMNWYNQTGAFDDSWYMGMVILGDPALILRSGTERSVRNSGSLESLIPAGQEEKEEMFLKIQEFDRLYGEEG